MKLYSVGEAARLIGVQPRDISTLFYRGLVRNDIGPITGGRRLIAESNLPLLVFALKRAGYRCKEVATNG